jgi:hypothetical protein
MIAFTAWWSWWRLWRKSAPLLSLVQEGIMSKNLFQSRIFWANVITAAIELSGVLGGIVPAGTLQLLTNCLNIALRLVTSQPVTVLPVSTDGD